MTGHVFISYARVDGRKYAAKLEAALQAAKFKTWRDIRDLDPHQDFTAEIEQGISDAEYVIVCVTPDIKRSDSFVRREIQYAMLSKKRIVPLRFADLLPPLPIINLTRIDFFGQEWDISFAALEARLKDEVYEPPDTPPDPYYDYLKALYEQIVVYLQQTVFALNSALIELHAESSPDTVEPSRQQALPLAFFGQAGINNTSIQNERKQFASFHEAFNFYEGRVLLLGDPGAGKTTTLLAFVRDAVAKRLENSTLPLPITAPISTWDAQKQPSLANWLAEQIPLLKRDDLVRMIAEGKTLLALDGLDELGGIRHEKKIDEADGKEKKIAFDPRLRLLNLIPSNNQIIIGCRIGDYSRIGQRALLKGAITLHVLDDAQMQAYLGNQPDLWAALQADHDLREIARTPLLLSLFAFAYNGLDEEAKSLRDLRRSDLRDKIFETYVHRRYEFEKRKPNSSLKHDLGTIYTVLEQWAMHDAYEQSPQNNFTLNQLFNFFEIEDLQDFVEEMILLHILRPIGRNAYGFMHLLLRDYFAYPILLEYVNDPNLWEYAIHGLANITGNHIDELFVSMLQSRDYELLLSVADLLEDHVGNFRLVFELSWNLKDWNSDIRENSAKLLGKVGNLDAVPALIEALNDTSWFVAKAAAEALELISTTEAVAATEAWYEKQRGR